MSRALLGNWPAAMHIKGAGSTIRAAGPYLELSGYPVMRTASGA